MIKKPLRRFIFFPVFLIVIFCFNDLAHAVALDDGGGKGKAASLLKTRSATKVTIQNNQATSKKPEYVPNEVIVKLKAKATPNVLYSMAYSQRQSMDVNTLSNLKARYGLRDERPAFKHLHEQLKSANMSQALLDEKINVKTLNKSLLKGISKPKQPAQSVDLLPIYILNTDEDAQAVADRLKQDPDVEYAQPNYIRKVQMVPNDPYYHSSGSWGQSYDDLWGIKKIQCEQAWDISQGEGIVVAVIDTGADYNHPDLWNNIYVNPLIVDDRNGDGKIDLNDIDINGDHVIEPGEILARIDMPDIGAIGWDFVGHDSNMPRPSNNPMDGHGHGTHVSGTIAAVGNNIGVIGVAPKAKIMPIKGLDDYGNGYDWTLAQCIAYAADNGAKILSNSWGESGTSAVLTDAFHYADSKGCVCIAAAGNNNIDVSAFYPADIDTVIAVAASTQNDEKASFSNYGNKIDVSAPGGGYENELGNGKEDIYNILSAMPDTSSLATENPVLKVANGYWRLAGTSMACPHAAGVAALILSNHPEFTNQKVRAAIRASSDDIGLPGFDIYTGYGRINAYNACQVQAVPEAYISYPVNEQGIGIGSLNILGSAEGNYILEYKNTATSTWTLISSGENVINSALGTLVINTNNFSTGSYLIRLTVNKGGYDFVDVISLWINTQYVIEETQITTDPGNQKYPAIYGDKITWTDDRNGNNDIYMYDLSTHQETQITTDSFYQEMPAIYGDKIVWLDLGDKILDLGGNVYIYDLSTRQEIYVNAHAYADLSPPAIYEDKIIWEDNRNWDNSRVDIYMYNLSTSQETQITTNLVSQFHPAIYGDKIVYSDDRNGNSDIYMYDLSTHQETQIATDPNNQSEPAIYGDKIVYSDDRNGNSDIYMYDLSTHQETQITTDPNFQGQPAIYGDKIVWTDGRKWTYQNQDYDIYMYDLSTHQESWIVTNPSCQSSPAIYDNKIVWTDTRNRNRDIYMATISPLIATPTAPTNLTATFAYDIAVKLTWTDNSNNEDGFIVERKAGDGNYIRFPLVGSNITQLIDAGTAAGTIYTYRVCAYNASGNSPYVYVNITTPAPPPAPTNLVATYDPLSNKIILTWAWLGDPATIEGFRIERMIDSGSYNRFYSPAGTTRYEDSAIVPNTTYTYKMYAYKGGSLSAYSNTVNILSNDIVLEPIGQTTVDEGKMLTFNLISHVGYGSVTYSASNLPSGATIDPNQGVFRWTPTYEQSGVYMVTFVASCGTFADSKTANIIVNNVNRPPVLNLIGNKTIDENKALAFTISATDPDSDSLTYSATGLPQGAVFDSANHSFIWTPTYDQLGSYQMIFSVSDGSLIASETIIITVCDRSAAKAYPVLIKIRSLLGKIRGQPGYIEAYDIDHNGGINVGDGLLYRGALEGVLSETEKQKLRALGNLDTNYDGILTAAEAYPVLVKVRAAVGTVRGQPGYVEAYDVDLNGGINLGDYLIHRAACDDIMSDIEKQKNEYFPLKFWNTFKASKISGSILSGDKSIA